MKSIFNRSSKGFTLIELLVVIAIIAILATIILASLGTARQRARNTRATSEMSQMRAQAELFAGNQIGIPSYGGVCLAGKGDTGTADGLETLIDSVDKSIGGDATTSTVTCADEDNAWAAVATIGGNDFCVDSTGFAGEGTGPTSDTGPTVCTPTVKDEGGL